MLVKSFVEFVCFSDIDFKSVKFEIIVTFELLFCFSPYDI